MFGLGLGCKKRSLVRLATLRVMVFYLFTDFTISCWWLAFAMVMILPWFWRVLVSPMDLVISP
jgi:hypothetical protein